MKGRVGWLQKPTISNRCSIKYEILIQTIALSNTITILMVSKHNWQITDIIQFTPLHSQINTLFTGIIRCWNSLTHAGGTARTAGRCEVSIRTKTIDTATDCWSSLVMIACLFAVSVGVWRYWSSLQLANLFQICKLRVALALLLKTSSSPGETHTQCYSLLPAPSM